MAEKREEVPGEAEAAIPAKELTAVLKERDERREAQMAEKQKEVPRKEAAVESPEAPCFGGQIET